MRYGYSLYLEDSLGYDLTVEQLLDNISVYYDDSTEYDEDYEEMEAFAENYLEEFHTFVEQYAKLCQKHILRDAVRLPAIFKNSLTLF